MVQITISPAGVPFKGTYGRIRPTRLLSDCNHLYRMPFCSPHCLMKISSLLEALFLGGSATNTLFCLPSLKLAACTILQMKIQGFGSFLLADMSISGYLVTSSHGHLTSSFPWTPVCITFTYLCQVIACASHKNDSCKALPLIDAARNDRKQMKNSKTENEKLDVSEDRDRFRARCEQICLMCDPRLKVYS